MKKQIILTMITLLFITTTFAQRPEAPACTNEKYPLLYIGAYQGGPKMEKGALVEYVTMTIPISNLKYLYGLTYTVTHPVYQNECAETTDTLYDQEGEALRTLWEKVLANPTGAKKEDFSISLKYVNGVPERHWKLHSYYITEPK